MGSEKQSTLRKNLGFKPLENVLFAFLGTAMFFCVLLGLIPLMDGLTAYYQSIDFVALSALGLGGVVVFLLVFVVISVLQLGTTLNTIVKDWGEMESN